MQADRTVTHRDGRTWENCTKYGTRLRRQAGTDTFKSTVSEAGKERVKHLHAKNWTEARKLHERRLVNVEEGTEPDSSRMTMDELAQDFFALFEGLVASGERKPGTLERRRHQYRAHVQPPLVGCRFRRSGQPTSPAGLPRSAARGSTLHPCTRFCEFSSITL